MAEEPPTGPEEVWIQGRRYDLGGTVAAPPPGQAATATSSARRPRQQRRAGSASPDRPTRSAPAPAPPAAGAITSPLQGTVIRVLVEEGAKVEEGDTILLIEAMKMENEVVATHAGTVSRLAAAEKQSVAAGEVLAVIEPEANGG